MAVAARGEEHQGKEEEKQEQLTVKLQEQHQRMQQLRRLAPLYMYQRV